MNYDSFGYEITGYTPVGTCAYSGDDVYAWSDVIVFPDGAIVLQEYELEYLRKITPVTYAIGKDVF